MINSQKLGFLSICLTMLATSGFAQTGSLHGTITDEETGMELIGANLLVVGTSLGATTDLDGNFHIVDIPAGTYDIRISFIGYNTKVITGIQITTEKTVKLDINLAAIDAQAFTIDDIRVTAERILSTSAAVLAERKKAAQIGDAISAEQIARSPDATSGDALKRVTGLSVVDNKYVWVRGVTDRYNTTALNGTVITSTDVNVDKKSFSFDLVPAPLISNTIVVKTATPDLPGVPAARRVLVRPVDGPIRGHSVRE